MRYLDNFFSVATLMFFERTKSHNANNIDVLL